MRFYRCIDALIYSYVHSFKYISNKLAYLLMHGFFHLKHPRINVEVVNVGNATDTVITVPHNLL